MSAETASPVMVECIWCRQIVPLAAMRQIEGTDVLLCPLCYARYLGPEGVPEEEGEA